MDDSCVCLRNATLTLQIGFLIMDGFVYFLKTRAIPTSRGIVDTEFIGGLFSAFA